MTYSSSVSRYQTYGLTLVCDFALPELTGAPHSDVAPDVVIEVGNFLSLEMMRLATAPEAVLEDVTKFTSHQSSLLFSDVGRFTITEGRHILLEPLEGRSASTWRLPLLGPVLALLLEQRGLFVLHAGAVAMGGFAAAFLGDKGQGKSTLNAAFSCAGYPLLSDDVVALSWPQTDDAMPLALPGFAQIKLVPDAVRAVLGREPAHYPAVASELAAVVDKRSFMASLATRPLPLRHLFVLSSLDSKNGDEGNGGAESKGFNLRRLTPQDALIRLMPHTFGARFGDLYLKNERKTTHFRQCARVVGQCQVWELARHRDLALLPATLVAIARAVGASPSDAPLHN